jgi:hypothetical protein
MHNFDENLTSDESQHEPSKYVLLTQTTEKDRRKYIANNASLLMEISPVTNHSTNPRSICFLLEQLKRIDENKLPKSPHFNKSVQFLNL